MPVKEREQATLPDSEATGFIVSKEALLSAVDALRKAVPVVGHGPSILKRLWVEGDGSTLSIRSSNGFMGASVFIESDAKLSFLVDSQEFATCLGALPKGDISISVGKAVTLVGGSTKFSISVWNDTQDFPFSGPTVGDTAPLGLDSIATLLPPLLKIATDLSGKGPSLNGLCLRPNESGQTNVFACSSLHFARVTLDLARSGEIVLPKALLSFIGGEPAELTIGTREMGVSLPGRFASHANPVGSYPNVDRVVWEPDCGLTCNREKLTSALKAVAVVNKFARIGREGEGLFIECSSGDQSGRSVVPATFFGDVPDGAKFRVNVSLILEVLPLFSNEDIRVGFGNGRAVIFTDPAVPNIVAGVQPLAL